MPVDDDVERTLTGWEYYPPALGIAVRHTWDVAKHTPIFVTENGIATADDRRRIDYTFDALAGLHDAMDDGIDVRGYTHWSLLDNYEWGSFKLHSVLSVGIKTLLNASPRHRLTGLVLFLAPES